MYKMLLAGVIFATSSFNSVAVAQTADPCAVVLCMRGAVDGKYKVSGCEGPVATYFSMQVWSPKYNASATERLRNSFIGTCTKSNAEDRMRIQRTYGRTMYDPSV